MIPLGILVVNHIGVIEYANSSSHGIFGYDARESLNGRSLTALLPSDVHESHTQLVEQYLINPTARAMGEGRDLYGCRKDGSAVPVEIGLQPLKTDGQVFVLVTVVDITKRKENERRIDEYTGELARRDLEQNILIEKLQLLIKDVKTLQGIIPICANCKKVRDDKDYWQSVEAYLAANTEANFSYSYCPECLHDVRKDFKRTSSNTQEE